MDSIDVGPFRDPNCNHAFLHAALTESASTTDIMVTLNTPYRRNPTDDRYGNARYVTISHPDWQRVAPPVKLAVQSWTAIWINKRLTAAYDVKTLPVIPDVALVDIILVAQNPSACCECRHNTIPIPVYEIYASNACGEDITAEYDINSATNCTHRESVPVPMPLATTPPPLTPDSNPVLALVPFSSPVSELAPATNPVSGLVSSSNPVSEPAVPSTNLASEPVMNNSR